LVVNAGWLSSLLACRWFEVNYAGTPAAILDVWFGTYSEW